MFDRDKLLHSYKSVHGDVLPLEHEKEYFALFNWKNVLRDLNPFLVRSEVPSSIPKTKTSNPSNTSPKKVKVKKKKNPFKNAFGSSKTSSSKSKSTKKASSSSELELAEGMTSTLNHLLGKAINFSVPLVDGKPDYSRAVAKGLANEEKSTEQITTKINGNDSTHNKSSKKESINKITKKKKKKKKNPFKKAFGTLGITNETKPTDIDQIKDAFIARITKEFSKQQNEIDEERLIYRGVQFNSIEKFNERKREHQYVVNSFEFNTNDVSPASMRALRTYRECGVDIDTIVPSIKFLPVELLTSTDFTSERTRHPEGLNFLMEVMSPLVPTYLVNEILKRMTKEEVRLVVPNTIQLPNRRKNMTVLNIAIQARCNAEILALLLNKMEYLQENQKAEVNDMARIFYIGKNIDKITKYMAKAAPYPIDNSEEIITALIRHDLETNDDKDDFVTVSHLPGTDYSDYGRLQVFPWEDGGSYIPYKQFQGDESAIKCLSEWCDSINAACDKEVASLTSKRVKHLFTSAVGFCMKDVPIVDFTQHALDWFTQALRLDEHTFVRESVQQMPDLCKIIVICNKDSYFAMLKRSIRGFSLSETMEKKEMHDKHISDLTKIFEQQIKAAQRNKTSEIEIKDLLCHLHVALGYCSLFQRKWSRARQWIQKGFQIDDGHWIVLYAKHFLEVSMPNGDRFKALEYLKKIYHNRNAIKGLNETIMGIVIECMCECVDKFKKNQYERGLYDFTRLVEFNVRLVGHAIEYIVTEKHQNCQDWIDLLPTKYRHQIQFLNLTIEALGTEAPRFVYELMQVQCKNSKWKDALISAQQLLDVDQYKRGKKVKKKFQLEALVGKLECLIRLRKYDDIQVLFNNMEWNKWESRLDLMDNVIRFGFELIQTNRYDIGVYILQKAIQHYSKIVRLVIKKIPSRKLVLRDYFMHCYASMKKKDFQVTIQLANTSIFIFDNDHEAMAAFNLVKAKAHRLNRDLEASIKACKDCLKLSPNCGRAFFEKSLTHMIEGNISESRKAAKKCLELNSEQSKYASMILQELE
eukprot:TRINITY_DN153_c0_g1_i8.p1 TRINITY_DN153_c0_g1~~TRINITY_DN153_c0_g1_i8.p1  ORF type:complete len:1039 (+),score=217.02 TRINITY_DN153_c0_g1_i8:282-3398(+)